MTATPKIWLKDIWPIVNPRDYKVHFATPFFDKVTKTLKHPLDAWVRDPDEWLGWQVGRGKKNVFDKPYIFSLMDFPRENDIWLFGGIFRVLATHKDHYEVELADDGAHFVGRLKLRYYHGTRGGKRGGLFEKHYDSIEVAEILPEPFSGRRFQGHHKIDLSFVELEDLVSRDRPEWKAALSVNGVYLITDTKTGKRYVGSAYGSEGIWGRWANYAGSGHGGNKQLRQIVGSDRAYPRANFRFTLLEFFRFGTFDREDAREREGHWKEVLLTRNQKFGLNSN